MLSKISHQIFQDFMPGNICFGCGNDTKNGLHVKSFWGDDVSLCDWQPKVSHQGWPKIMNGGIIATIIDCHSMGTAMAYALKHENRPLGSLPEYKYATGTLSIKYIAPTPNLPVRLKASVISYSKKKVLIKCELTPIKLRKVTVSAKVLAFRVYDSSKEIDNKFQT
ncbi:MAG: PaaI family thioesterase [Cytophagales bacterium]|nr:PaaI family thioesterase [Cytophagales bacterium]